ncbi:HhH-GPD domain [Macleaya cordata]|uniref:HhH-GPD domain n=1 Tax=Macleaya cordata TaxID=56857 RepID=A0A200Q2H5_MACCD|nr:HhH-GPD domain [Macleaya cordata]
MDNGRGFLISNEKEYQIQQPCVPVTPSKPIPTRAHQISGGNQPGTTNSVQNGAFHEGYFQEIPISNGSSACLDSISAVDQNRGLDSWEEALANRPSDHVENSFTETPRNTTVGWNNIPCAKLLALAEAASGASGVSASVTGRERNNAASRDFFLSSYSQINNNLQQHESASMLLLNQNLSVSQNMLNSNCFSQIPHYGFPASYHPDYDLSSLPTTFNSAYCGTIPVHLEPVTPDHGKRVENHLSEIANAYLDDQRTQANERQQEAIANTGNNVTEHNSYHLQPPVESSCAAPSIPNIEVETQITEKGMEQGIDLNTPPTQQKQRRKKHRPKVVIEGKPKRTPKPKTPKQAENPSGKRKYVRKGVKATENPSLETARDTVIDPTWEPAAKSCKRVLNFDLEVQARDENHRTTLGHQNGPQSCSVESSSSPLGFTLNKEIQAQDSCTVVDSSCQNKSTLHQHIQGREVTVENSPTRVAFDLNQCSTQMLEDCISLTEKEQRREDSVVESSRNVTETAGACMNRAENGYPHVPQQIHAGWVGSIDTPTKTAQDGIQSMPKIPDDSNCRTEAQLAEAEQARGSKREYCHMMDKTRHHSMKLLGAHFNSLQMYQGTIQGNEYHINSSNRGYGFPPIHKKKRTEKGQHTVMPGPSSSRKAWEDSLKVITACRQSDPNANHFTSQVKNVQSAHQFNNTIGGTNIQNGASNFIGNPYGHSMPAQHNSHVANICAELHSQTEAPSGTILDKLQFSQFILNIGPTGRKKRSSRVRNLASLTAIVDWNQSPPTPPKIESRPKDRQGIDVYSGTHASMEALSLDNHAKMTKKKRTKRVPRLVHSTSFSPPTEVCSYEHQVVLYDYNQPAKSRGPSKVTKHYLGPIDEIIQKLHCLSINSESNTITVQGQNAIVLFEPIKKRKPRAKVDLDPETDRVWKLLMGKESSQGVEGTEADKEKWWEEERQVFRGRADSFIARMHLVQGDRRFTQWKGSVVDSVIGVFLTQNVSDNLSSSAFMSLAARFPLQPTSYEEGTNVLVEEPEVWNVDSDDPEQWHENLSDEPVFDQGSISLQEAEHVEEKEEVDDSFGSNMGSSNLPNDSKGKQLVVNQSGLDPLTEGTGKQCFVEREDMRAMEDVVSSESSIYSAFLQTDERDVTMRIDTCLAEAKDRRALDDVVSSQTSDSSVFQPAERIGSCSDSNSEAEDMITGCKSNSFDGPASFMKLLQIAGMPGKTMLQEHNDHECGSLPQKENSNSGNTQSECNGPDKRAQNIPSSNYHLRMTPESGELEVECLDASGEESKHYLLSTAVETTDIKAIDSSSKQSSPIAEMPSDFPNDLPSTAQAPLSYTSLSKHSEQPLHSSGQQAYLEKHPYSCKNFLVERVVTLQPESTPLVEPANLVEPLVQMRNSRMQRAGTSLPDFPRENLDVEETTSLMASQKFIENKLMESNLKEQVNSFDKAFNETTVITSTTADTSKAKGKPAREKKAAFDWDSLRKEACLKGTKRERTRNTMDTLDYDAVRCAEVGEIAETIKARGMNNMLAERIKDFLNRIVRDHGSIDLEWLRDVPPDQAKEYLLSVRGLGLKSVECVRLLTLHHLAFPVDTNVGRIAVRLGWVPLQPLPESLQLHLLELYPMLESIQKYLWPRLCKLDQRTLYELHYQMITFGKVFCTKNKPNCNACPMRAECKHFASAFASARLALPGPEEKGMMTSNIPTVDNPHTAVGIKPPQLSLPAANLPSDLPPGTRTGPNQCEPIIEVPASQCEPIIEVPASPETNRVDVTESDIEDAFLNEDPDEIPSINLNIEEFALNLQNYMQENNMELQGDDMSKALVALTPAAASIPMPKLKNVGRLRTEHQVYELPDSHPLLEGMDRREPDDPCSYLLAIWTPGETADSIHPPERSCTSQGSGNLCNKKTCFSCNSTREANSQIVRGTLLIPCRTAMRGSFPLNGTYFQVNEVFADHASSQCPITVPRAWIWNLPRRTVFFGTSVISIFKGLSTEAIQSCFWKGFVCVRGFDQKTRAPRPLLIRFHMPASKMGKLGTRTIEDCTISNKRGIPLPPCGQKQKVGRKKKRQGSSSSVRCHERI